MFKIEIFSDAKQLPKALVALDGLGYNCKVTPVRNATPTKSGVLKQRAAEGTAREAVMTILSNTNAEEISRADLIQAGMRAGHSMGSMATAIVVVFGQGLLSRITKGQYAINRNKLSELLNQ